MRRPGAIILGAQLLALGTGGICFGTDASAEAVVARGVSPAEINNRLDLVLAYEKPKGYGERYIFVPKYDADLGTVSGGKGGVTLEWPVLTRNTGPAEATGCGDFLVRGRWVTELGGLMVGPSVEVGLPMASDDAFGTGKWVLSSGAVAVKPWGPQVFSALVVKYATSVAGDGDRPDVRMGYLRGIQAFLNRTGGYALVDVQRWHSWEGDEDWWLLEAEVGQMVSATQGVMLRGTKLVGDRENDFGLRLGWKVFF